MTNSAFDLVNEPTFINMHLQAYVQVYEVNITGYDYGTEENCEPFLKT